MNAKFYLHPDCIKYDSIESLDEYTSKFSRLIADLSDIIDLKIKDTQYVYSDELYSSSIFQEQNIYEFIKTHLDHDSYKLVMLVLSNFAQEASFTPDDIERISVYSPEEESCNALIVLNQPTTHTENNKYIQFDKYELVYNKDSWQTVRRQILGNHPGTSKEFMEQANIYFTNIVFSSHCSDVIESYLSIIPRKIVYYLSCINDRLVDFWENSTNKSINDKCADFAGQYGMDRAGSQQGTPSKSDQYTFEFKDGEVRKSLCCGAHFKITHIDDNCNNAAVQKSDKFHARIYFNVHEHKVYVGSIGPHV
jgi:hypothetical protein